MWYNIRIGEVIFMKLSYARNLKPARFLSSRTNYVTRFDVIPDRHYKEYCFTAHNHSMLEVIYMLDGELLAESGESEFHVKPGDLLIFNPYEPHSGILTGERLYASYIVFNLELEQLSGSSALMGDESLTRLEALTRRFVNYVPASEFTAKIGRELESLVALSERNEHAIGSRLRLFGSAAVILGELIAELGLSESEGLLRHSRFTQAVTDFISANYSREIAPEELPELLGISRSHFCYLFKKCFGQPFSNYLVEYRLERALELLSEPASAQLNIAGISQSVGFTSYAYFARCFKRKYGLSMSEYIRNGG